MNILKVSVFAVRCKVLPPTLQTEETVLSLRWMDAIPSMNVAWKMMQ